MNESSPLTTTLDTVRHEKLLRVRYINGDLPHGFSLALQDKYVLTSHTLFRRFTVRSIMPLSETRVSAVTSLKMQHLHPHVVPTLFQILLGMTRLS